MVLSKMINFSNMPTLLRINSSGGPGYAPTTGIFGLSSSTHNYTRAHACMHAHTNLAYFILFCPKNNVFAIFMQFLVILINMSHPHQWTPSWKCCYYVQGMK